MKYTIRKAKKSDVGDIYSLLHPYSKEGLILERSHEELEKSIEKFFVAESNNIISGVISYYHYSENLNEIRSLAVKKSYKMKGIGIALVNKLVLELLKNYPKSKIFALSYHPEFFKKAGFFEVLKETLPEKIWKDCKNCKSRHHCGETALVFDKKSI